MMTILAVAAGFAADLAFGDPRWLPHPVVAMGRAITWAEAACGAHSRKRPRARAPQGLCSPWRFRLRVGF